MARVHHGYTSRDELFAARERAIADYGSATACGSSKRATKIRRYARSLGVSAMTLNHTSSAARRIGCKAAQRIKKRAKARLS